MKDKEARHDLEQLKLKVEFFTNELSKVISKLISKLNLLMNHLELEFVEVKPGAEVREKKKAGNE